MSRIRSRAEITSHQSGDQWSEKKYSEADLERVRLEERERCAKIAATVSWSNENSMRQIRLRIAQAIRATPESEGE